MTCVCVCVLLPSGADHYAATDLNLPQGVSDLEQTEGPKGITGASR